MFEKLKDLFKKGKDLLYDPAQGRRDEKPASPEGVTEEQLIREARAYVDSIMGPGTFDDFDHEGSDQQNSEEKSTGAADDSAY